ncbi:MAG: efflux RND transporter periplasmic adaptor subunit [Candidatus Cloacimonadales bacterium]
MKRILILIIPLLLILGCEKYDKLSDAYGNFESEEVIISSESHGVLTNFDLKEGDKVELNQLIAVVDTTDKALMKMEITEQLTMINLKRKKAQADLAIMQAELDKATRDVENYQSLYNSKVVALEIVETFQHKRLILSKQLSSANISLALIKQEAEQLKIKLQIADRELQKCQIKSPISGTILTKYVQEGELLTMGKPLLKLTNLNEVYLKAYVTQTQLSTIKLNQSVTILIDDSQGLKELSGEISYINSKAEFTPKTIQTRNERANLVYAIKVRVPYESAIKIGMPAEVIFVSQ